MSLPGSKPTGQPTRRRNKPTHEWNEVVDVLFDGPSPALPKVPAGQPSWPTATKRWWKAISHMPHCVLWSDADWQFAIDSAYVAAEFHRGDMKAATELRQREKVMGTTVDFRRDLRIRYVPEAPESSDAVVDIDSYRESLRG